MKKIGIMTFHRALNYGAVLQCYALQKTVGGLGAECEVVDYICPKIAHDYKPFRIYKNDPLKSLAKSCVMFHRRKRRAEAFAGFTNNLIVKSKKTYTHETITEAKDEYDCFITGSDQVWSPRCVGFDPAYFLTFADDAQKYSYAASFAVPTLPDDLLDDYRSRLSGFQTFSVREQSGEKLVRELTGRDSLTHLDPSLLLSAEEWGKVAKKTLDEPYILMYKANPPVLMTDFVKKLSKEKNLPVYAINDAPHLKNDGINYIVAPTPEEFVGLFQNAACVVTNSFHGTAFSVIFRKEMFVEFRNAVGKNIRAYELLSSLGINREITENTVETPIDWDEVERRLNVRKQEAFDYLRQIVDKAN